MKKYLLPKGGKFYKANLHCHSTVSDGELSPEEIKKVYIEKGYSIVAYTDHDVLIAHPELADENFLPLNGYEVEINESGDNLFRYRKTCHMCFIALEPDNLKQVCYHRSKYLFRNAVNYRDKVIYDENIPDFEREHTHECINEMIKRARKAGFFVTYNHPNWSLENYNDYIGYDGMNAMEICNYACLAGGFLDYNEKEYDDMLRAGKRIYCISADDNHVYPKDFFGGYIMIKADKLEYKTVTDALLNGDFYASQGPEIYDLYFEDGKIFVSCSDAKKITLHTGSRLHRPVMAQNGEVLNSAVFDVTHEDEYVRITITDMYGNHANTNAFFTDELFK